MFLVPFVGYIMIKVLLHFSDSKKGSSFGLKPSNGVALGGATKKQT